jgi:hypothetical protein
MARQPHRAPMVNLRFIGHTIFCGNTPPALCQRRTVQQRVLVRADERGNGQVNRQCRHSFLLHGLSEGRNSSRNNLHAQARLLLCLLF